MSKPRWVMSTVPSSGTRYIRDSIKAAKCSVGYEEGQYQYDPPIKITKVRGPYPEESDLIWGHFDTCHEIWMAKAQKDWPHLRHFVVVRNPIHTLCTRYRDTSSHPGVSTLICAARRDAIIEKLDLQYRVQLEYIRRVSPYIHRVEDPIASLGIWLGIGLREGGDRFTQPNDLREAVNSRDADRCFRIAGPVWEWFTQTLSGRLATLYRDRLGYDFWWA